MTKKILINLSFSIWPMLGYELDFIQQQLNQNNVVKILYCDGSPDFCTANKVKLLSNSKLNLVCNYCKSRLNKGIKWIDNKKNLIIESFDLLNVSQKKIINEYCNLLKKKSEIDSEILNFLKNIDINLEDIIRTSIISETTSTKYDHKHKNNFEIFKKISKLTIETYYSSLNHLNKFNADEIYIFNGRIYRYQPMLRIARSIVKKENTFVYEFPLYGFQNMMIVKNSHFADLENISNELLKFNNSNYNLDNSDKENTAKKWIVERETGKNYDNDWYPWKKNQVVGSLPKEFNKSNFNITYFASTETEFLGIPENEKNFGFKDNLNIIETILQGINNKRNISLIIKTHPLIDNDTEINLIQMKKLQKKYPNMIIVKPKATVDSYELIKNSELIVVMGSTIGIESAFYKKNVISLTNSPYMKFGATKRVVDANELKLLLNKCINNNFEDFPSDNQKYSAAINFIHSIVIFNFKSKFLIKKSFKNETMIKNNIHYKISFNNITKFIYLFYASLRFILKKINIYI